jgi:hypothetical protein
MGQILLYSADIADRIAVFEDERLHSGTFWPTGDTSSKLAHENNHSLVEVATAPRFGDSRYFRMAACAKHL